MDVPKKLWAYFLLTLVISILGAFLKDILISLISTIWKFGATTMVNYIIIMPLWLYLLSTLLTILISLTAFLFIAQKQIIKENKAKIYIEAKRIRNEELERAKKQFNPTRKKLLKRTKKLYGLLKYTRAETIKTIKRKFSIYKIFDSILFDTINEVGRFIPYLERDIYNKDALQIIERQLIDIKKCVKKIIKKCTKNNKKEKS